MISIKIYRRANDVLIAACDEKLIGKTFEEGKYQIKVRKDFYDGNRVTPKILKEFLKNVTIANLVGDETIKCAIEMGLINPGNVIKIKGVPHAQMVKML
jgi:hypothetical protein